MPRRPKNPGQRQRSNTPAPPLPTASLRVAPELRVGEWQHPETQAAWEAFWRSPLALYVIEPDLPDLRDYFDLMDERVTLLAKLRSKGQGVTVRGSTKNRVLNPIYGRLDKVREDMTRLAMRFGLNPEARRANNIDLTTLPQTDDADIRPALVAVN